MMPNKCIELIRRALFFLLTRRIAVLANFARDVFYVCNKITKLISDSREIALTPVIRNAKIPLKDNFAGQPLKPEKANEIHL